MRQHHVPEPYEYISLLIDDIERQDAQAIVRLYRAGSTVLVERTLSHPREHVDHRIDTIILVFLGKTHYAETVR